MATERELLRRIELNTSTLGSVGSDSSSTVGTPQAPVNGSATTTAADIVAANASRTGIYIHNHSGAETLIVNFGADADAVSAVYRIQPEQTLIETGAIAAQRISGITSAGTIDYTYLELTN